MCVWQTCFVCFACYWDFSSFELPGKLGGLCSHLSCSPPETQQGLAQGLGGTLVSPWSCIHLASNILTHLSHTFRLGTAVEQTEHNLVHKVHNNNVYSKFLKKTVEAWRGKTLQDISHHSGHKHSGVWTGTGGKYVQGERIKCETIQESEAES